jgi:hypothetical protein
MLALDLVLTTPQPVGCKPLLELSHDISVHPSPPSILENTMRCAPGSLILTHRELIFGTEYHNAVTTQASIDPPFDSRWLDDLANACSVYSHTNPRLVDLFLERRIELRVVNAEGAHRIEECRTEGAAVRWQFPNRTVLSASSGTSPQSVTDLLATSGEPVRLPTRRPIPPAELDPPRGWRDWAAGVTVGSRGGRTVIRYLDRQAVVVGPRRWSAVTTPPLVRVESDRPFQTALLSVWNHPQLNHWLRELAQPAPSRSWRPDSGLTLPVIFTSGTAGVLFHELIGHAVEADLVLSGDSPLAPLGQAVITAPTIQIADDPTRFDLPGAFSHDDEGATAQSLPLISGGRLVGWLCDSEGGGQLGSPAGRGRRASWDRQPSARLSNLLVAAGDADPAALEHDLDRGVVVTRLGAATVDPVSHRLVLRIERGWEVRQGQRRRPLAAFELTGNVLEVLAHLEPTLGSDLQHDWRLGWCVKNGVPLPTGSEAPTILAHRLEVL